MRIEDESMTGLDAPLRCLASTFPNGVSVSSFSPTHAYTSDFNHLGFYDFMLYIHTRLVVRDY